MSKKAYAIAVVALLEAAPIALLRNRPPSCRGQSQGTIQAGSDAREQNDREQGCLSWRTGTEVDPSQRDYSVPGC